MRCQPDETGDWSFGNPLTYFDCLAYEYGRDRFGYNEGFHGALVTRFGLLKGKAWMRRQLQVEGEVAIAFMAMHALSLEQRRRVGAVASATVGAAGTRAA